jgi:glutamine cyclotransferase
MRGSFDTNKKLYMFLTVLLIGIILYLGTIFQPIDNGKSLIRNYTYSVIDIFPHDPNAFTQGLVFDEGVLYEGTGLHGQSSIRKVELDSGKIIQKHNLSDDLFGEGITIYQDKIYQITWKAHLGFIYNKTNFQILDSFMIETEGWGLTHDGYTLILSDGTDQLYFLDLLTLDLIKVINITAHGIPVDQLNELEYVNGEIYANIWQTNKIARIDLDNGHVVGWIYLDGLTEYLEDDSNIGVLNGIAYDIKTDRLFVTGKLWPSLFQIKLKQIK